MTVTSPNVSEIKLDRLIDDMRLLRSQMIAFDMHLKGIEAYLKAGERSERRRESKSRPWFAAAASAPQGQLWLQSGQQPAQQSCFIWQHDPTTGLRGTRLSLNPMPDQPRQKPPPREDHGRDD
jgi:hypothetical protein